jgi:hypothetical protein
VGGAGRFAGRAVVGVHDVEADVALDHLGHEALDGPVAGGDGVQDGRAVLLLVNGLLDAFDLTPDAADAVEQFLLVADGVGHGPVPLPVG